MRLGLDSSVSFFGALNVASLFSVAARIARYPGFLALPGARSLFLGVCFLLLAYAGVLVAWRRVWNQMPREFLHVAVSSGSVAAVAMCAQMVLERFVPLQAGWNGPVTLLFMLLVFSIWGWAAFRARRSGLTVALSFLTATLSALITMSVAVAFGVLLELYLAPVPLESMRSWAEFQRSGWNDLAAFAIANTMDSAISHLVAGPLVACVFGGAAIAVEQISASRGAQARKVV